MHPFFRQPYRLLAYLLAWIPLAGLLAGLGLSEGWSAAEAFTLALPLVVVGAFLCLTPWYLCRALPVEGGAGRQHFLSFGTAALVIGGLWSGAAWALARLLSGFPPLAALPGRLPRVTGALWAVGSVLYIASVTFHYLLLTLERSREAERRSQEAEARSRELAVLAREAELQALRNQINPHFLFNVLNALSALTTLDPPRARELCVLLSDFLRQSLALGSKPTIPMREEWALAERFLALHRFRLGDRLVLDTVVDPAVLDQPVPPLCLQPLLENAIQHGVAQMIEPGRLVVRLVKEGPLVRVRVENDRDPDSETRPGTGLGQRNVRERLRHLHGDALAFEVQALPDAYRVTFTLPWQEPLQEMPS